MLLLESFLTLLVIGGDNQGQELFVAHGPHVIREEMVLRYCRDRGRERNPLSAVSSDIDTCRSLVGERKGIVGKGKDLLLMGI